MNSFSNIPQVTKNILILNGLFYLASFVLEKQGVFLTELLGVHYFNSPLFKPYQLITSMFMHSSTDITHIFFNMFALVMFGSHLERIWGSKRFFIFYLISGIGAVILYNILGVYELNLLKQSLSQNMDIEIVNDMLKSSSNSYELYTNYNHLIENNILKPNTDIFKLFKYINMSYTSMIGASGAIFGIMAAFAYLFPNTELMIMFLPVLIKAKYIISLYFLYELFKSFSYTPTDNIAHLAHVGGAVTGFILVFIWNKNRKTFY